MQRTINAYLHFYIANFINGSNNRSADHRGENVCGEIATGISAFNELKTNKGYVCVATGYNSVFLTPVPLSQTITFLPLLSIVS